MLRQSVLVLLGDELVDGVRVLLRSLRRLQNLKYNIEPVLLVLVDLILTTSSPV